MKISQQAVRSEFYRKLNFVQKVLRKTPRLISEPGWRTFWDATQTISASDLPGFLATHRQYLPVTRYSLNCEEGKFLKFPPPVNSAKGFTAMSAFLQLANWEKWQDALEREKQLVADLLYSDKPDKDIILQSRQRIITKAEDALLHPKIPDSAADISSSVKTEGSFVASLNAFQRLAAARQGAPSYDFVLEHPSFIWIEKSGGDKALSSNDSGQRGKWVCWLPDLNEAVNMAIRLLPEFREGILTCSKFLLSTVSLGGVYFLTYSFPQQKERQQILNAASGRSSFFVYDSDCSETDALTQTLQALTPQLSPADVSIKTLEANIQTYMPKLISSTFGQLQGISEAQKKVMLAVLKMNPSANPLDRFNYLALTYFPQGPNLLGILLPKLFDADNASEIKSWFDKMRAAAEEK
ncbi:MAG: hypothetical protein ABH860_00140 [bacterium]